MPRTISKDEELKLRLLGRQPLSERVNPQAYDLFLQALYLLNHGDVFARVAEECAGK